jgi:DNA-binding transcriptional MerR regulator
MSIAKKMQCRGISSAQAARRLGVSVSDIQLLINRGLLHCGHTSEGRRVFRMRELERLKRSEAAKYSFANLTFSGGGRFTR